jgi:hypothetical protein
MIMVLFPDYKALQCTDVCESRSMPYNDFLDFYYDGWIETLDWVLQQDVELIDVGHYSPASSGPEDFHLGALPEPDVNLSIHPAPVVRPFP